MKNSDFLTDYCAYILLKVVGPLVRLMPITVSFYIGRALGDIFYLFALKRRATVYANIKTALGEKLSPAELRGATRGFFRAFSQNIIEIFYTPKFDKKYLARYVAFEGYHNIEESFSKGKGVIFAAVHAGGWEMSNIICANLGFSFSMFVREQNFPRAGKVLNSYRGSKGCRFIQRENELRELIRVLKANESVALTVDQGGRNGILVKFFDKYASMSSGAVRLALKLDCALVPVFPIRVKGPYIKFFVEPVFKLKSTGNLENDVRDNLQELVKVFEKYITLHPREYWWLYKTWKYSSEKNILILSDGKTGHIRQSQALAKACGDYLGGKGVTARVNIVEVKFKNVFSSHGLILANCLSGKYICQGCMLCLRLFLSRESYLELIKSKPDVIISCGSSLVPVNYQLSRESRAKSLVIMRPSVFSYRRFDLVIMAKHDRPLRRKNTAVIDGALNLISREYLETQARELIREAGISFSSSQAGLGLLLGGNTKDFQLAEAPVKEVLRQLKDVCVKFNVYLLATTSRRTPEEIDALFKNELRAFERVKLAIIAREKNYPSAVGGILGLCRIVVVSCESVSMISEAVSSLKHVVVFKSQGLSARKKLFLENFAQNGNIYLAEPEDIGRVIERILVNPPEIKPLRNDEIIRESLRRIL
ncbi:MAG: ELM1/GtrOC1 family putative glycosyltransferase [Candidatus Omnitrophota bacterium]